MNNIQLSQSFPLWVAAIFLTISAAIIIFFYYRTDKPLSRLFRWVLIALRVFAILLILFCLLEPSIIAREETTKKANLLILLDDSQSMSLTDAKTKSPRIEIVKEAISKPFLKSLSDRFDTHLYQFSSEPTSVDEISLKGQGTLTDISKAISKPADEWKGQPIAGIVLVSDGESNSGEDSVKTAQKTGIPIYTIGVGQKEISRDIQISRVEVNPIAYVDHILPIKVSVNSNGYDGRDVRITLSQVGTSGLRDSATLKLNSAIGEQIVDLQVKPQQEGTFRFNVSVQSMPDELTQQNNVYPFFVKVMKTKLKVIYIEGKPRWESTFINRALQRDPNIELTYLVASKQGGYYPLSPKGFPSTKNELNTYDVMILGDISPSLLKNDQLSMIRDFVENNSGSLVFLGGRYSFGNGGFGESSLKDMLPIEIGQGGARQVKSPFNPLLTQQGMTHPATRLSDDQAENVAIWRDFPPLSRFYAGTGIKSGATVLAEHQLEKGKPFIAFQRYGKGMVFMIAGDDLWQWAFGTYPFGGDDSYYKKFWSGTIRWLASVHTQAERVSVETDKQTYSRDENVRIRVYVYNENYDPVNDAQIKAQVRTPAGTSRDMVFTFEENGRYSAEFKPNIDGNYKVEAEAYRAGRLIGEGSSEFLVQTASLEFQNVQINEQLLRNVADISGGAYHHIDNIADLISSINESKEVIVSTKEKSIWDNGFVLVIALAFLTTEWILRKRKGLV
jgi:uncharacterized membrane protein